MVANRRGFFLLAAGIMAFLATAPAVVEASRPPLIADPVATYRPTLPVADLFADESPSSCCQSPAFTLGLAETRVWASAVEIGPRDWFQGLVSQRKHQGYTLFEWKTVVGFSVDPYGVPAAYTDPTEVPDPATADYDSVSAAGNTVNGRFSGGQNLLFQGLWTDPVSGISYARARWYDGRNVSWLSEDPLRDKDSPDLYAFVTCRPHTNTDPMGEGVLGDVYRWVGRKIASALSTTSDSMDDAYDSYSSAANSVLDFQYNFVTGVSKSSARHAEDAVMGTYYFLGGALSETYFSASSRGYDVKESIALGLDAQLQASSLGFYGARDKSEHFDKLSGKQKLESGSDKFGLGLVDRNPDLMLEGFGECIEGTGQMCGWLSLASYGLGKTKLIPLPGTPAPGKGETIFRVQGGAMPNASKVRFHLGADGKIAIAGDDMLFVNLGQEGRALEFLARRGETAELVQFQVTKEFAGRLRAQAVPQRLGRQFPGRPQTVDATRAPDQFGIPASMFDELLDNIVPGTFRSKKP